MSREGPTYLTFNNVTGMTSKEMKGFLQLYDTPQYVSKFNTLQIIEDLKIPFENWNKGKLPEPIVSYFPNFGQGGATQAITTTNISNFVVIPVYNGPTYNITAFQFNYTPNLIGMP